MATLCTAADLEAFAPVTELGAWFSPDEGLTTTWAAAAVQALAAEYCGKSSYAVLLYVNGRLDLADTGVQAFLKEAACTHALWKRWQHRGCFGPANKWQDAWKDIEQQLKLIQAGQLQAGDTPQPTRTAYVAGGGQAAVFGPDSDGTPSSFTEGW